MDQAFRSARRRLALGTRWRGIRGRVAGEARRAGIRTRVLEAQTRELDRRRAFGPDDLERLDALLRRAEAVVPVRTMLTLSPTRRAGGLVVLRHDTDRDIDAAVRFAEWEAARGYRATYFVLHTDWYYRDDPAGPPSGYVLAALRRIRDLGHEIGLHNNAVTVALRSGRDPAEVLRTELGYLREAGFDVAGTAAHGDALCRALGYNNGEVFVETPRPAGGAAERRIAGKDPATGRTVGYDLRPFSMASLGLTYEANFLTRRHPLTDSHGRWSRPLDEATAEWERARAPLLLLIHPAWWAFGREPLPAPLGRNGPAEPR